MVTNQKHSSDSTASEQEVIRYTEKLAQAFGLNEQNAEMYSALSGENRALKKQLERDVGSLKIELEDLDETVVELIHKIALSPNIKKCKGSGKRKKGCPS